MFLVVAQNYYGVNRAQHNHSTGQKAADEAKRFESLTRMLENGGEVAHADVVKAQLQSNQRMRDLSESQLSLDIARVNLAVLTFAIFTENFNVVEESSVSTLPDFPETPQLAKQNNLDVRNALAALSVAHADVEIARSTHRETKSGGCPASALSVDAARNGKTVQTAFVKGIETYLDIIAAQMGGDEQEARQQAIAFV